MRTTRVRGLLCAMGGIAVGAGVALAATGLFKDSGISSIEISDIGSDPSGKLIKTKETRFHDWNYYSTRTVLKTVTSISRRTNADGLLSQEVDVTAYHSDAAGEIKQVWRVKETGSEFEIINDDFVSVREFGCCDSPEIDRLLNTQTGDKVEATLFSTLKYIEIPNTHLGLRYVAIVRDSKAPQTLAGRDYVGTFSYFSKDTIIARVRIYESSGRGFDVRELKAVKTEPNSKFDGDKRHLMLWSSDSVQDPVLAFRGIGFSGQTSYSEDPTEHSFTLAISGDKINLAESTHSPGIELVPVDL